MRFETLDNGNDITGGNVGKLWFSASVYGQTGKDRHSQRTSTSPCAKKLLNAIACLPVWTHPYIRRSFFLRARARSRGPCQGVVYYFICGRLKNVPNFSPDRGAAPVSPHRLLHQQFQSKFYTWALRHRRAFLRHTPNAMRSEAGWLRPGALPPGRVPPRRRQPASKYSQEFLAITEVFRAAALLSLPQFPHNTNGNAIVVTQHRTATHFLSSCHKKTAPTPQWQPHLQTLNKPPIATKIPLSLWWKPIKTFRTFHTNKYFYYSHVIMTTFDLFCDIMDCHIRPSISFANQCTLLHSRWDALQYDDSKKN